MQEQNLYRGFVVLVVVLGVGVGGNVEKTPKNCMCSCSTIISPLGSVKCVIIIKEFGDNFENFHSKIMHADKSTNMLDFFFFFLNQLKFGRLGFSRPPIGWLGW